MDPRPSHRRFVGRIAVPVMAAVGLLASMLAASAASLGVSAGSLFAQELPVSIDPPDPPGPIVSTDFSSCSNFIDGWTDESGNTWTSHSGDWQCLGGGVVRAQQRVPLANLTVDIAQSAGLRISTEISDISHQNNRSGAGLSILGDEAGEFIYVIYERDEARLMIGASSGAYIGEVNGLPDRESASMAVEITSTEFYVEFDGQRLGPYPSGGLTGNTRFGLVADSDNFSRFDSFTIEALP